MQAVEGDRGYLGLETAVDVCEEGVFPGQGQNSLLYHGAFNIIIHQHHIFLQSLHCKILSLTFELCQKDLGQETREESRGEETDESRHDNRVWLRLLQIVFRFSFLKQVFETREEQRSQLLPTFPKLPLPKTLWKTKLSTLTRVRWVIRD